MMRSLKAAVFACVLASAACAQTPEEAAENAPRPVQVMVLGVYHFDNPGLDVNNIETDDLFTPERQAELDALGKALASFKPTKVAIEVVTEPPYVDEGYADFTTGDLLEEASEDVQIGYRVANLAGLDTVHAINEQPADDEPDYFPYGEVADFAEREGRGDEFAEMSDLSDKISQFETYQETWSVPALLKLHNSGFFSDEFYWEIIGYGAGEDQPGAELAAYWFMRNAKIFNKLQQVTAPGDRVLVIYGSGHKAWLDELVTKTPGYELIDPVPYLDRAIDALPTSGD